MAEGLLGAHLVNDEANGEQLGPLGPRLPPVLLHQGYQAGADDLTLLEVIVLLGEREPKLGVGPECVCGGSRSGWLCPSPGALAAQPHACLLNRPDGPLSSW